MLAGFTLTQLNSTGIQFLMFVLAIYINHILRVSILAFMEKIKNQTVYSF